MRRVLSNEEELKIFELSKKKLSDINMNPGKSYWNSMVLFYPEFSNITYTKYDCYYDSSKIDDLRKYLRGEIK